LGLSTLVRDFVVGCPPLKAASKTMTRVYAEERIAMSKFPSPFGKSSKTPKAASQGSGMEASESAHALQKFLSKAPPSAKVQPAKAPPGGYKPGMSGEQYKGEQLKDYSAMKPKDAARIFNGLDDNVLLQVAQEMKSDALAPTWPFAIARAGDVAHVSGQAMLAVIDHGDETVCE